MRLSVTPGDPGGRVRQLVALIAAALIALTGTSRTHAEPSASAALGSTIEPPGRANVLLVVADDMRADSLWAMTALTRLAAERGVVFDRAYATTPLCCPSRASILTGRYARHHGVLANEPPHGGVAAFDDRSTLATGLQAVGARTGLIGRYLNGYNALAIPPGWDWWFAVWQTGNDYYGYRVNDRGTPRYFGNSPDAYQTRVLGQQALQFIGEDRTRPFFLMLAPRTPHGDPIADRLDAGALKGREIPVPPSYGEANVDDKPTWVRALPHLSGVDAEKLEKFRRLQHETLLSLDRALERIVKALAADGRLDRTWIIFTSDNGLTLGEHRLRNGKACAYEECVRVPLVVVPPPGTLAAARTDDRLVANIDLAPTIAALMGAELPGSVDGRSLLPLLDDPSAPWRDALVLEQLVDHNGRPAFVGLRTADRKYVRYASGDEELYDEAADPYELANLAGAPAWTAEKERLAAQLDRWLASPQVATPAGDRVPR